MYPPEDLLPRCDVFKFRALEIVRISEPVAAFGPVVKNVYSNVVKSKIWVEEWPSG